MFVRSRGVWFGLGVCKTWTGYLRMTDAGDGCGWENADGKMRIEKCGKKKLQTIL